MRKTSETRARTPEQIVKDTLNVLRHKCAVLLLRLAAVQSARKLLNQFTRFGLPWS